MDRGAIHLLGRRGKSLRAIAAKACDAHAGSRGAHAYGSMTEPLPENYPDGMPQFGSTRAGVWLIKRIITPLDRWLYQLTSGRALSTGLRRGPVLLLTTTGRRTGKLHTTPVFYLSDAERLVVCSVNPEFERASPWTLNLRAHSVARVQVGRTLATCQAREASSEEVDRYWPRLIAIWPTYQAHYARSRQRALFVLEPTRASVPSLHA